MDAARLEEDPDTRKDAALALIERGFHVLAVKENEKRPDPLLAPNGFKAATKDYLTVADWWQVKRGCNIGVACGVEYNLVVLDVDVKGQRDGIKTLVELGVDCATLIANTPSGGLHLYFKHPGASLPSTLPGIDIKGANGGGYVVAPPSTLPNGSYAWRDPEMPVADFPPELLIKLTSKQTIAGKGRSGPTESLIVHEGQRHLRLVELGAVYRGKGLDADEIEALLWHHARYFDPKYSQDDPAHVHEIASVVRWYESKAGPADAAGAARAPLAWLELQGKVPPCREWAIMSWLPLRHPVLLAGRAGVGKTLLAQQLGSCLALGLDFIGETMAPLRVLLWAGEDDDAELWRRQLAVCGWLGVSLREFAGKLEIESFSRRDMTLAAPVFGKLEPTPLLDELRKRILETNAEFVILDNVARIYGGNENDRHQVTNFCSWIAAACGEAGVVLVAHPGKATGSEYSGSTAWEGSVRTRLYLGDKLPDETDDDEPIGEVRYLCRRKSNYSDQDWIRLEYKDGVLVPDSRPHSARHGEFAKDAVLRTVRKLADLGFHGNCSTRSSAYLPRLAKQYGFLEGLSEKQFGRSMRELIVDKRLTSENVGQYANRSPKPGLVAR